MSRHENTGEGAGDYHRPGARRDHRRARREWQRRQYRDADADRAGGEEAATQYREARERGRYGD